MELPQPPQDEELKNIIDKLAVFVARNGVEFESMTKQKQRENPRFAFLFGGEFYNYYMYRVTTEQAILKHRAMREQQQPPGQMRGPHPGGPNFQGFGGGGGGNGPRMQQPQGQNPFDIPPQQQQQQMGNFDQSAFPRGPPVQQGGSRFDKRNFNEFDRGGNFQGGFGAQGAAPGQHFGDRQPGGFDQRGNNFDMRMSAGPGPMFGDERGGMGSGNFKGPGPAFRNFDQRGPPGLDQRGPPGLDQRGPPGLDQRGPPGLDQRGPPGLDQRGPPGLDQRGPPGLDQRGPPGLDQRGPPGLDQRGPPGFDQRGPPGGQGNFDRGPPGGSSFDRGPPPRDFDQRERGLGFDRGPPGTFEPRGLTAGRQQDFDQRGPPPVRQADFDQRGPQPGRQADFDQRGAVRQADFDQRVVPSAAFDAGNNSFEQKRSSRFDSPVFEKQQPPPRPGGFEPARLQQPAPAAVAVPFQQEVIKAFEPKPGPSFVTPGPNILAAATGAGAVVTPAPAINVEVLTKQKAALEEQIRQSELNLAGQQQVLLTQQQNQIEEAIRQVQATEIQQLSMELNVDMGEFDKILQPIVESCTKDAISTGKAWIFTHTSTPRHYHLVTSFLLKKVFDPSVSFSQRLHVIYLVNDVLHHCMRKGAEDLQQVLENMVIPMFCFTKATEVGNEENLAKLDKLFGLWETKSNYVSPGAVDKLRNYNQTLIEYKNDLMTRHGLVVAQISSSIQQTFDSYQTQHKLFCQHVAQNIKTLEQQIQQGIIQDQIRLQQQQQQQEQERLQQQPPPLVVGNLTGPGPGPAVPPIVTGYPGQLGPNVPTGQLIAPPYVPPVNDMGMVDLSKPPPGFPTPPPDKDLIPAMPYYELPAGLMVPMVKLEDDNYKPLDPKAIRLPPPCPPTDRLLQAVEAFYANPSHERPRDSEGWERLGLYEYFKAKNLARKQKEDDIREGRRDKSRSPTPVRRDSSPNGGRSPPRRRYLSKSPTFNRLTRSSSRRSRSRSPSTSGSSSRRNKRSRRSRSRSRSPPPRRSPSPPSFSTAGLGMDRKLDESNKGHQLLKKMGWSGMGLGLNEQGIEAPISGGEVRERKDQYKGVGVAVNDPFESYRKSKGQAFVERMRARAEERL